MKYYKEILIIILCWIVIIESAFLFIAHKNGQYNTKIVELKNKGLDMCEDYIELTTNTLYNYETYCPEVIQGLENGSLELLKYNLNNS